LAFHLQIDADPDQVYHFDVGPVRNTAMQGEALAKAF
jgi:hypothetical protein